MSKDVHDYLMRGIHGDKELRASEKIRYLGEFRERVLLALKQGQVRRKEIYPQVKDVIRRNPDCTMLLNGEMEYEALGKYMKLADDLDIPFRKFYDNQTDTEIGLVLAAPHAVDIPDIYVTDSEPVAPAAQPDKPVRRRRVWSILKRK